MRYAHPELGEEIVSEHKRIKTFPENETLRLAFGGDISNSPEAVAVHQAIAAANAHAAFVGGDISYDNGMQACYAMQDRFLHSWEKNMVR